MRKYVLPILVLGIVLAFSLVHAQQKPLKKKIVHKGKAFLADGKTGAGTTVISKVAFDSLIAYPLIARDTLGRDHKVLNFSFSYAERGLFEDSTGKLKIMTDYYATESEQGKLPEFWLKNIRERSKGGDTAYFDLIIANYTDTGRSFFYVEPIKLIITE